MLYMLQQLALYYLTPTSRSDAMSRKAYSICRRIIASVGVIWGASKVSQSTQNTRNAIRGSMLCFGLSTYDQLPAD
jgi:hypothetical protein